MKLSRSYTIAVDKEFAEKIERYKKKTNKSYTDIFREGVELLLKNGK